MVGKVFFTIRYWLNNPPWDTGITPPEVYEYLDNHSPGKALDLGCGTGTNSLTMAENGWQTTGVDFVPRAVRIARRKAHRAGLEEKVNFQVGDVLSYGFVAGEYDLILDIGCFHSFRGDDVRRFAENVALLIKPGGNFLLYAHLKEDPSADHGASEADFKTLEENLTLVKRTDGKESSRPSAWLEFEM
jgi:SAM-dependent methyltransferase